MSARLAAVLLALLVVAGGSALLYYQSGQSRRPAASDTLGRPLLKGLKAADIAAIAIREPNASLTLERKAEGWAIAERGGFPADLDKVRGFVLKAIEWKIGQAEPIGEKDRARLQLEAAGTQLEFRGADGKPLARMTVGKKYFKREPDQPDRATPDGRFVLLPDRPQTVYVVSDPLAQASTKSADWIATTGVAIEQVKTLELRPAAGAGWRIERAADNADWKLAGAKAGEKLEVTRANSASYSLSSLTLADIAPPGAKDEDTGLAKPTVAIATTFDGLTYTLRIGKLQGENHAVAVAIAGDAKPQGKDAEARAKKLAERLPREKALTAYVLYIPRSKLEDVLRGRADLLEKKPEKKK